MVTWNWSKDEDIWMNAKFDTEEECIEEAKACEFKSGNVIYIGDCIDVGIDVYLEDVLEFVEHYMYEEVGEVSEGWNISNIKNQTQKEIYNKYNEKLRQLILDYLKEIGETPDFYKIQNIREVVIE